MWLKILLSVLILLNLAGCATTKRTSAKDHVRELEGQVSDLETQLKQRDEEIQGLEKDLAGVESAGAGETKAAAAGRGKASPKQIQTALSNAGFYEGSIDGKIGKNSKKAIKAFQEANGLSPDGVIGSRTWSKLKAYLQ